MFNWYCCGKSNTPCSLASSFSVFAFSVREDQTTEASTSGLCSLSCCAPRNPCCSTTASSTWLSFTRYYWLNVTIAVSSGRSRDRFPTARYSYLLSFSTRAFTPICPSAWPPSQPTCRRCSPPVSTTPNMSPNLNSASPPLIWSTHIRNGECPFVILWNHPTSQQTQQGNVCYDSRTMSC